MGSSVFRRKLLELLRDHAQTWVKEVSPEELLTLSLLDRSVSFQRLSLQENFLDSTGVKLPLVVHTARLENVVVTAVSSHVVRVETGRVVVHGEVLPHELWMQELEVARQLEESDKVRALQAHEMAAMKTGEKQAAAGSFCVSWPDLQMEVAEVEIVLHDRVTRPDAPFALAATSSGFRLAQPFVLDNVMQPTGPTVKHMDMRFKTYEMFCSNIVASPLEDYMSVTESFNRVLGPCEELQLDLRISSAANMFNEDHSPQAMPAPDDMGRDASEEEALPMVSLAIRTTGSSLCFTQRQLANIIAHGRTWGLWFMCAQTFLNCSPPEDACKAYRDGWLMQCIRQMVAESPQSVPADAALVAFEEQWPCREVLRQRTLAILSTSNGKMQYGAGFSDALSFEFTEECACCRQTSPKSPSEKPGSFLGDPSHATTFVLDVNCSNTAVELKADPFDDQGPALAGSTSLCVVPLDRSIVQSVRYVLHVDNRFDIQPISNELLLSNCRLEFVDRTSSTPLVDICDTLYCMFDIGEHNDALLCPAAPPRRTHLHLGRFRGNLILPSFLDGMSLISGALDLAELDDNPWDAVSVADLQSHCIEVVRHWASLPPLLPCPRLSNTRLATTDTISFLVWPEIAEMDVLVLQMALSCVARKAARGIFELGRDCIFNPDSVPDADFLGREPDEILSATLSGLLLWRPTERPADQLPAARSSFWLPKADRRKLLQCEDMHCHMSMDSMLIVAQPLTAKLSCSDIILIAEIIMWWRLELARMSKSDFEETVSAPMSTTNESTTTLTDSLASHRFIVHEDDMPSYGSSGLLDGVSRSVSSSTNATKYSTERPVGHVSFKLPSTNEGEEEDESPGSDAVPTASRFESGRPAPLSIPEDSNANQEMETPPSMQEMQLVRLRISIKGLSLILCESSNREHLLEVLVDEQRLDAHVQWGSFAFAEMMYTLRHFSITDPRQNEYLLYCGRDPEKRSKDGKPRRHDAISFIAESGIWPSSEGQLDVQPLWMCSHWTTIGSLCAFVAAEMQEHVHQLKTEKFEAQHDFNTKTESGEEAQQNSLQTIVTALENWTLQVTLQQIVILVPMDEANTMRVCARLGVNFEGVQMRAVASGVHIDIDEPPKRSSYGSRVTCAEKPLLRPARMRLLAVQKERIREDEPEIQLAAYLKVEPLRFAVHTAHASVVSTLIDTVTKLQEEIVESFLPFADPESYDPPADLPSSIIVNPSWAGKLTVYLEAAQVGFVDSTINVELCTMLLEDSSLQLSTNFVAHAHATDGSESPWQEKPGLQQGSSLRNYLGEDMRQETQHSSQMTHGYSRTESDRRHVDVMVSRTTSNTATPPYDYEGSLNSEAMPHPMVPKSFTASAAVMANSNANSPSPAYTLPVVIDARIRAFSINVCQSRVSRPFPLLEPVSIFVEALGSGKSRCMISWLNVNLSSTVIEVLARLLKSVKEETAAGGRSAQEQNMECQRTKEEQKQQANESAAATPISQPIMAVALVQEDAAAAPTSVSDDQPEDLLARPRGNSGTEGWITLGGGCESCTMSSPLGIEGSEVHVYNHLGRTISIRSGGFEEDGFRLQYITLRMAGPDDEIRDQRLLPSPQVQVLEFGTSKGTRPLSSEGEGSTEELGQLRQACSKLSWMNDNSSRRNLNWHILARQGTSNCGKQEQEIHLSSVMFIDNRIDVSLLVVPVCLSCNSPLSADHQDSILLTPESMPQAIPLGWFMTCRGKSCKPTLYCGLANHLSVDSAEVISMETRRKLVEQGRLQSLVKNVSWKAMNKYRTNVAGDYFLSSTRLILPDGDGPSATTTSLCANIYGISQDLDAVHSALFFTIALEPLVQVCNRLCCPLVLAGIGIELQPGDDHAVLQNIGANLKAAIRTPSGLLQHEGSLKLNKIVDVRGILNFCENGTRQVGPQYSHFQAHSRPTLEVFMSKEPGLCPPPFWSHFKVFPYQSKSYRIIIFTRYWIINRRSDCNVFIPHGGRAKHAKNRNTELFQVPRNSLRMLTEQAAVRGRMKLGLYDHWNNSHGAAFVPVTGSFSISQPTEGLVRVHRSKKNPASMSFGYTSQAESGPFYRTLIVEIVRRYTIINQKTTDLLIKEKGDRLTPIHVKAGEVLYFDPQGSTLELAIAGWSIDRKDLKIGQLGNHHFSAYFSIATENNGSRFQLHHSHHTERISVKERHSTADYMFDEGSEVEQSSPPRKNSLPSTWALWKTKTNWSRTRTFDKHIESKSRLPLTPRPAITTIDLFMDKGAVIVTFSEPQRPAFRVVNRTGHTLSLCQDTLQAPLVDSPPIDRAEDSLHFAWFNPWRDQRLEIWKEDFSEKQKFVIEQVQRHPTLLKVRRDFEHAPQNTFWEEFTVSTKVINGCREVHIRPWCRVINRKDGKVVFVQAGELIKGQPVSLENFIGLQPGQDVCLRPVRTNAVSREREHLALHISSHRNIQGSTVVLKGKLAGQKGYVRHRKCAKGEASVNQPTLRRGQLSTTENNEYEVTEVVVHLDQLSDFLVVELMDCTDAPYVVENQSRHSCTIVMASDALGTDKLDNSNSNLSVDEMHLMPGKLGKFVPQCWDTDSNSCKVTITSSALSSPFTVDLEHPGLFDGNGLEVWVSKGRPRRIVVKDFRKSRIRHHRSERKKTVQGNRALRFVRAALASSPHPRYQPGRLRNASTKVVETTGFVMQKVVKEGLDMIGAPRLALSDHIIVGRRAESLLKKLPRPITKIGNSMANVFTNHDGCCASKSPSVSHITNENSSRMNVNWEWSPNTPRGTPEDPIQDGLDVRFEGAGIALLDSMILKEVAYVCVNTVHACSWKAGACTEFAVKIDKMQVDVRDGGGRGRVVLQRWHDSPSGFRAPSSSKRLSSRNLDMPLAQQPIIDLAVRWRVDGDLKNHGHIEVQDLSLEVSAIEVRMDTDHLFLIAEWAHRLHRSFLRFEEGDVGPQDQGKTTKLVRRKTYILTHADGDEHDPIVGEPRWKERSKKEESKAPTPVFIKNMRIRKIEVVVSWRFSGRQATAQSTNSELARWHYILKKALPFDLSQAAIFVGRHRTLGVGKRRVTDIKFTERFLQDGFPEIISEVVEQYKAAVFFQTHRIIGSGNVFLNVPRLLSDMRGASALIMSSVVTTRPRPKLFLAAVFLIVVAFMESLEDFCTTLAKTLCHWLMHRTPAALRREPSGLPGIMKDAFYYSFPWHFKVLAQDFIRLVRHARSTRNARLWVTSALVFPCRLGLALVSALLVILAKAFQFLHVLARSAASALTKEQNVAWKPASPLREGPQQYYMGGPLQFSQKAALVLSKAGQYRIPRQGFHLSSVVPFAWCTRAHWQTTRLPDNAGLLLAVKGRGFCLVCEEPCSSAAPESKRSWFEDLKGQDYPKVVWLAVGDAWKAVDVVVQKDASNEMPLLRLQRRQQNNLKPEAEPKLLKLGSIPAIMTAYGFIRMILAEDFM